MLPNHEMDARLTGPNGPIAYFAKKPNGKAIIFVHGYTGHATETWQQMHEILPLRPEGIGVDLIFYAYQSTRGRAATSGALLRQFINDLEAGRFARHGQHYQPRPSGLAHDRIVIAAHSLGAAVSRRAMLDGELAGDVWVGRTRLGLFAPAHRGAHLAELGAETGRSGSLLALLFAVAKYKSPIIKDLVPGSTFLQLLETDAKRVLSKRGGAAHRAKFVIFGDSDAIAEVQPFGRDPPMIAWAGHTHTTVCKTRPAFLDPLRQVVSLL